MAKRGPRRLKTGVQSRFGPNSTVEFEAVFRKKFWGGLNAQLLSVFHQLKIFPNDPKHRNWPKYFKNQRAENPPKISRGLVQAFILSLTLIALQWAGITREKEEVMKFSL